MTTPRPIDRVTAVSRERFYREYLTWPGKPVIVTDGMDSWPAKGKWSFDFFRRHYGDDVVAVNDDLVERTLQRPVRLGEYLDYCESPAWSRLGRLAAARGRPGQALYVYKYAPFQAHPELREDIGPLYFCDDWYRHLSGPLKTWFEEHLGWIFIGPAGTLSRLHIDLLHTHSYLGQLAGRKRAVFFPPDDTPYLYDGGVDPWAPDLERFPRFAHATAYEGEIGPGDLLFFPAHWWHHVRSLEPSITASWNVVNETNFAGHLAELLRVAPVYLRDPSLRAALGMEATP